jgi:DNA polymerase III subunit delta'
MFAPWLAPQLAELLRQRGHAWLLQGAGGLGQCDLGLALVMAWLCEQPVSAHNVPVSSDAQAVSAVPQSACGHCPSCHAVQVRTHADLKVLMPEAVALQLDWPVDEKAQKEIDDKKRKASQEIRVEALRGMIEFAQRSNARGRGKAVLIYPAERMNAVTANALLKTLEEPPGDTRFVLITEHPQQLLPTIRSRCLQYTLHWPSPAQALPWLEAQGLSSAHAAGALQAAGGRPQLALDMMQPEASGQLARWAAMPNALKNAQAAFFADWSVGALLDAQQKLCHDLMLKSVGSAPRYFEVSALPAPPGPLALSQWWADLAHSVRHKDHPFKPELYVEALVAAGHRRLLGSSAP